MLQPQALLITSLCLAAGLEAAGAEEIRNLEVSDEHGRYSVRFDALLDVPLAKARPLLIEPTNWPRLSEIVADAEVLGRLDDGARKVRMVFSACILFFCKTLHKVEEMRELDEGEFVTLAIPEQSDFSYARERWRISGSGGRTRVQYEAELVPSFFVPPLIGPYILKSKMQALLTQTAQNLERLAQ